VEHLRSIAGARNERSYCPYCGSLRVNHFKDGRDHTCGKWFMAIWLIRSQRKGIACMTLAKDSEVTQKTACFMLHRLRHAARTKSFSNPLEGMVEVDKTFIGCKDKNKHARKRQSAGRGAVGETGVFGRYNRREIAHTVRLNVLLGQVKRRLRHKELIA
jgi:hypothetical protein